MQRTSDSLPIQEILDEKYNSRYINPCQRLTTCQNLNLKKPGKDLRSDILGFVKDDSFIFDLEPFHCILPCDSLMISRINVLLDAETKAISVTEAPPRMLILLHLQATT